MTNPDFAQAARLAHAANMARMGYHECVDCQAYFPEEDLKKVPNEATGELEWVCAECYEEW